jgi:hypothetical protein
MIRPIRTYMYLTSLLIYLKAGLGKPRQELRELIDWKSSSTPLPPFYQSYTVPPVPRAGQNLHMGVCCSSSVILWMHARPGSAVTGCLGICCRCGQVLAFITKDLVTTGPTSLSSSP